MFFDCDIIAFGGIIKVFFDYVKETECLWRTD